MSQNHDAIKQKSKAKMKKANTVETRVAAFLEDLVENIGVMRAQATQATVTKDDVIAMSDDATRNLSENIPEIAHDIAHGPK